jgi:hypothetical protein
LIEIDEEFKHLIPPLTTEEYKLLEQQCIKQGIRVPLTVWNPDSKTILIDGHNRYQIAQKHNLPYTTEEEHFESRNEAIVWICDNQLGRRNIHPLDGERLLNRKRKVLEEEAKKRQSEAGGDRKSENKKIGGGNISTSDFGKTRDIIGKELGVSGRQVDKLHRINEMASPQVKDMVRNGTLSVNQAYNTTFPKTLNPVKEATKEHEEYQEKLKSGVVDINEAKKDKTNQDILYNGFMVELYKVLRTVTGFGMMYTYKDIDKHTKKIPQQESEDLILKLDAVIGVLDYVRTEIERSNNERN